MHSHSNAAASSRKNPAKGRSAITNGTALLADVDGRSVWYRRFKDLCRLHANDFGGPDVISQSEAALIKRASCLIVELERMENTFAEAGASTLPELETYQRASNSLRRLLQALGLQRRPRDVTLTLGQVLRKGADNGRGA